MGASGRGGNPPQGGGWSPSEFSVSHSTLPQLNATLPVRMGEKAGPRPPRTAVPDARIKKNTLWEKQDWPQQSF